MDKILAQNISTSNFEQCLKCTICTVYCPVSAVNPDYPGPKQAGPDNERMRLKNADFYDKSLKYCLNCKRCEVACPSNVKIGDIIQAARIKYSKDKPKLRDMILANTDIVGTMASTFAPIVNTVVGLKPIKMIMDKTLAIDHHRTFPKYSSERFESWYSKQVDRQKQFENQVSYFHGCYVNYNHPKLGKDLLKIMNAIGYGIQLLDEEKCCGVALISNGLIKQAKRQASINIKSIRKAVKEHRQTVIGTSSTCIFTLRDEYHHLLDIDNDDVKDSIELATRFLFRLIDNNNIKLAFKDNYKARIAYHTPCHMEKLGWTIYSTSLIRMIPGVQLTMLDSQCCGIAGTYGFKKENYKVSQKIGDTIFKQIEDLQPDIVATDCETCKWQIEMSTSAKVENPISIIADALDVEETMKLNNVNL